jgi:hypothetical protein
VSASLAAPCGCMNSGGVQFRLWSFNELELVTHTGEDATASGTCMVFPTRL